MARGRMINQKISEDIDFNSMSIDAQFLFMRTVPFLDRDGIVLGHPSLLWSKVAPLLPQYATKMKEVIAEWVKNDFVVTYIDGKTPLLFFKGFSKNQAGLRYDREPASEHAAPPGYYRADDGIYPIPEKTAEIPPAPTPSSNGSKPVEQPAQTLGEHPADFRQIADNVPADCRTNRIEKNINKTTTTRAREPEAKPNSGSGGGSDLPNTRNRQSDQEYARLCQKFENNGFGTLTQIMAEEINALMDEYPADWIDDAMTVSVEANKRQLRYTRGILVRWRSQGKSDKKIPAGSASREAASPPVNEVLPFKKWCLQKYNTTFIEYIPDIPEKMIRDQYEQYKRQSSQQTH